jgi:hypothetical protein
VIQATDKDRLLNRMNWVGEKIDAVRAEIAAFAKTNPYACTFEHSPQTGECAVRVHISADINERLSFAIADAVHHMRATLDNLAWQVAAGHAASLGVAPPNPTRVQWPIFSLAKGSRNNRGFREWLKGMRHLYPLWALKLFCAFQPYRATHDNDRHALLVLNTLWNTDKHREILAAQTNASLHDMAASTSALVLDWEPTVGPVDDGDVILRFRVSPPNNYGRFEGHPTFTIGFRDPPLAGDSVEFLLHFCRDCIRDQILPAFMPHLP